MKLPPRRSRRPAARAALALPLALAACTAPAASPARIHPNEDPSAVVWEYEVRAVGTPIEALEVLARFAPGSGGALTLDEDAAAFVRGVAVETREGWRPALAEGGSWAAPCAAGCRVRYRYALREAAMKIDDGETAVASGDVVVAPPSTWLLHPEGPARRGRLRMHLETPPAVRFAAGMHAPPPPAPPGSFEAQTDDLAGSSYAVFGDFHPSVVTRDGARVDVAIAPHGLTLSDAEVTSWVDRAVEAIGAYYGRFPAQRALAVVMAGRPASDARGVTMGDGGGAVLVRAPGLTSPALVLAAVRDDWVMTHELIHVTLPSLPRQQAWLSEGLASYVEPFARARVGQLTPEKLWRDLYDGLPQGLPLAGDEGLDRTHTWGRTYWGGALFCLLADVTLREKTAGARSLIDALRAVVATGANVEAHWGVEQFLDVADGGTGTTVLHDLYRSLALAPGSVDLPALWARLGVRPEGQGVAFDEGAPLSPIRRSMTPVQAVPR